jgi:putative toxin-antitoxin system antitoxin component (TIGR02293 family)
LTDMGKSKKRAKIKGYAATLKTAKVASGSYQEKRSGPGARNTVSESLTPFAKVRFRVTVGGRKKDYLVRSRYGYFISSFRKAENMAQVSEFVEQGLPSKEIIPIVQFLDLKVPEIAKAAAVSPSTVSRWNPETSIGVSGSSQFFRIDEVIRKGVNLFGGEAEFKNWLNRANLALGNEVPAKLMISFIGVDLIDEALDALQYGNVM